MAKTEAPWNNLPPLAQARVAGLYAQPAVNLARARGADLNTLGEASGLGRFDGILPDDIPVTGFVALLDAAARQLGDPFFGARVGRTMHLTNLAGYGLALCACKTLREAIEQSIRFEPLAHDLGRMELAEDGEAAFLRWRSPWQALDGFRQASDLVFATTRAVAQWLAGVTLPRGEIDFAHAPPVNASIDEYERLMCVRLRFGAESNRARFPRSWLAFPVASAHPDLLPDLSRVAESRLAGRRRGESEPPLAAAARERIRTQLSQGRASLPEVAGSLGLTPRSLQRRLAEGQIRFSELLDEVRRELALTYLRDRGLSLAEVAFLLGFGEQSTFNHAFRNWFASTPKAWRENHLWPTRDP